MALAETVCTNSGAFPNNRLYFSIIPREESRNMRILHCSMFTYSYKASVIVHQHFPRLQTRNYLISVPFLTLNISIINFINKKKYVLALNHHVFRILDKNPPTPTPSPHKIGSWAEITNNGYSPTKQFWLCRSNLRNTCFLSLKKSNLKNLDKIRSLKISQHQNTKVTHIDQIRIQIRVQWPSGIASVFRIRYRYLNY